MAGPTNDFQNGAPFYLDATQQDLLLAALASNNQNPEDIFSEGVVSDKRTMDAPQYSFSYDSLDPAYFTTPPQPTTANTFDSVGIYESPFADLLDGDTSFDMGNSNGEILIGAYPGGLPLEGPEKRKMSLGDDDEDDEDEGGGKRKEGEDKQAKKPGRKPLTSEPTTKRKAQNRAAQRAFRERKEKHLKDLETKVQDLEKASDTANHENGLLRAQVQRLQIEVREYRKRMSLNRATMDRAPAINSTRSSALDAGFNSLPNKNYSGFSFEFPRFGDLPGTQLLDNGPLVKPKQNFMPSSNPGRRNSVGSLMSPPNRANSSMNSSPVQTGQSPTTHSVPSSNNINDFFGFNAITPGTTNVHINESFIQPPGRVFQFNSGSSTHSNSPSASSTSPNAVYSSCATSPDASHNSPNQQKDAKADGSLSHGKPEAKNDNPATLINSVDLFASQNGGQFDLTLSGEYRDAETAIIGDSDFTNGLFNDAFLNTGYVNPSQFGDTSAYQRSNPLEDVKNGDEIVPGNDPHATLNCQRIWDKLSSRPDFQNGTIDIDNLCSELRAKARCSDSGVVVNHEDVEAALKRQSPS